MLNYIYGAVVAVVGAILFVDLYIRKKYKYACRVDGDASKPQYLPYSDPLVGLVKGLAPFFGGADFRGKMFPLNLRDTLETTDADARAVKTVQTNFVGMYMVNTWDPECIRQIMFDKEQTYEKVDMGVAMEPLLGQSILQVSGEEWKRQKSILGPAFHHDHIKAVLPAMENVAEEMVEGIMKQEKDLKDVSIHEWTTRATVEVIGRAGFGHAFNALRAGDDADKTSLAVYEKMALDMQNPVGVLPLLSKITGHEKEMLKDIDDFEGLLGRIVAEKKATVAELGDSFVPSDILDLLLQAHNAGDTASSLSDKQLMNNLAILFVAGHETSASAVASTVHFLAENPEAQTKAREEVLAALAESDGKPLSYEQVCGLTYLKQCIHETLRIAPPAAMVIRKTNKDTTLGGYRLGKGRTVLANMHAMHHDEDHWQEPFRYMPERFEAQRNAKRARCTFVPFAVGPRQCLGNNFAMLEMRVLLVAILSKFDILPAHGDDKKWAPWSALVLQPKPTCRVHLVPRA
eukprot:CAMPEP_0114620862 /NCGR_PEP_ID=MMETSP0168-20121206/8940_1 /TAXON_ID=95228 ORGANISM="Vannella sp., Strain DIVA3 517/6/12" /NCGR_SAMPLE_ID=MMETSP0168 /ASSEMBLY_ACC=CAM_ASM_000044 /LENGTH=516 /DNA_ID=CAMNT_0001832059 /DNA_START=306 /DNA_END=1856 /DNA_ORIENTATION=+